MPQPSPYDLIQKAARRSTAADRWTELKANTQQRTPLQKPQAPASDPPIAPTAPEIPQPPFFPPQPHHPYVDEVVQRHEQAWKNALPLQSWGAKEAKGEETPGDEGASGDSVP